MSVLRVGTGAGAERARGVGKLLPGRGRGAVGARQICWERSIELALFEFQRTYYQAGIYFCFSDTNQAVWAYWLNQETIYINPNYISYCHDAIIQRIDWENFPVMALVDNDGECWASRHKRSVWLTTYKMPKALSTWSIIKNWFYKIWLQCRVTGPIRAGNRSPIQAGHGNQARATWMPNLEASGLRPPLREAKTEISQKRLCALMLVSWPGRGPVLTGVRGTGRRFCPGARDVGLRFAPCAFLPTLEKL